MVSQRKSEADTRARILYTRAHAAAQLDCNVTHFDTLVRQGHIRPTRIGMADHRYSHEELERFVALNTLRTEETP